MKAKYWDDYTRELLKNFRLSPMQLDRLGIIKILCSHYSSIADIGSGSIEPIMVCNVASSVAVDLSTLALRVLKQKGFKGHRICASATILPFKNKTFEITTCNELIEHLSLEQIKETISELSRIAKRVVMTTPNCYLNAKIKDPTHKHFFTKQTLEKLIPKGWQIYSSHHPYNNLNFYIPYKSPRFSQKKLGRLIYRLIDKVWMFPSLQKILFIVSKGAFLIVLGNFD